MGYSLTPPQPTINVCAKIKCPFFNSRDSGKRGCRKYSNSEYCHLTSVFAFKSDGKWLFTADEIELRHLKNVNDRWIAENDTNFKELLSDKRDNSLTGKTNSVSPNVDLPIESNSSLSSSLAESSSTKIKFAPSRISILDSIQFEDY